MIKLTEKHYGFIYINPAHVVWVKRADDHETGSIVYTTGETKHYVVQSPEEILQKIADVKSQEMSNVWNVTNYKGKK